VNNNTQITSFRFTLTYFSVDLGYFVDAINEARATYPVDKSFWQIRSELVPTKKGNVYFLSFT
jgi:hypothetical protein